MPKLCPNITFPHQQDFFPIRSVTKSSTARFSHENLVEKFKIFVQDFVPIRTALTVWNPLEKPFPSFQSYPLFSVLRSGVEALKLPTEHVESICVCMEKNLGAQVKRGVTPFPLCSL